jgi:diaminopimelate epimerase
MESLMEFSKLEGLGNDFVVMNSRKLAEGRLADLARRVCDRHFGVGADGLILFDSIFQPANSDFKMRIFNADGGEAELSGNGLRCLGAHLIHFALHSDPLLRIETAAGLKRLRLVHHVSSEYTFEVEMGAPILERSRIPLNLPPDRDSLVGCELELGANSYQVTITSMGNPHCSLFVSDFEVIDWQMIGRQLEVHPTFPNRTNVEFIRVVDRNELEVRFWERGVGTTHASGTGSCAAVVASVLSGHTDRQVRVRTPGGDLKVEWRDNGLLILMGPARLICHGDYNDG